MTDDYDNPPYLRVLLQQGTISRETLREMMDLLEPALPKPLRVVMRDE